MRTIGGVKIPDPKTDEEINAMIDSKTLDNYKGQGAIPFSELPNPSVAVAGFAWDITTDFVTDDRFLDGPNRPFAKGSNIVCVKNPQGVYKFDVLSAVDMDTEPEMATTEDIENLMGDIFKD